MPYIHAAPSNSSPAVVYTDNNGDKLLRRGGSRSWRNNNPGNMRYTRFAREQGAIGAAGGFAVFPSTEVGRTALLNLLTGTVYSHLTIAAAVVRYAPPAENDTERYERLIAKLTGLDVSRKISDLSPTELASVVSAIQTIEGYAAGSETPIRKVIGAKKREKRLTKFLIEGESEYMTLAAALRLAVAGEIDAVAVRVGSRHEYLRSRADGASENNFLAIAEIEERE